MTCNRGFLGLACGVAMLLAGCGLPTSSGGAKTNSEKLHDSNELALTWLDDASSATSVTSTRTKISALKNVLNSREKVIDVVHDGGPCTDNTAEEFTLAYIKSPLSTSSIHVCTEAFTFDEPIIAQVLIHEGTHGTGNADECSTTKQELQFMTLAGQKPFKNAYVDSTSNPDCSSYNLGAGIDFIVLDDGVVIPIPSVQEWSDLSAPHEARYIRVKRSPSHSLMTALIGRNSSLWLSNILHSFYLP
ncbi:MAG: hypothetical protein ABIR96_10975 [Bdellovibrionota bacterium]